MDWRGATRVSMMVVAMVKLKAAVRALQMVEATEIAMAVVLRAGGA